MTEADIIETYQDLIETIEALPDSERATITKRIASGYRFNTRPAVPSELKEILTRMPPKGIWDVVSRELKRLARNRCNRAHYKRKKKNLKRELKTLAIRTELLEEKQSDVLTALLKAGIIKRIVDGKIEF